MAGSSCRTGRTPRRRAGSTRPRRRRRTGHTGGATWRMCEGFGASMCWDALRAERWPPGEGAERRSWTGSWVRVRWVGAADAKDANKRRPCQEKRCTTVRGWVSKRIGDRCSHCKRLSLSASRAHWPVLSRAALAGEQASFVNVSTGTAFTTTVPHSPPRPAAPRSLLRPNTHTMAMRLAVSRPLAAAAARSTAARAFSTTALRAKEIAGENTETPNMRVGSCIASSWPGGAFADVQRSSPRATPPRRSSAPS